MPPQICIAVALPELRALAVPELRTLAVPDLRALAVAVPDLRALLIVVPGLRALATAVPDSRALLLVVPNVPELRALAAAVLDPRSLPVAVLDPRALPVAVPDPRALLVVVVLRGDPSVSGLKLEATNSSQEVPSAASVPPCRKGSLHVHHGYAKETSDDAWINEIDDKLMDADQTEKKNQAFDEAISDLDRVWVKNPTRAAP